MIQHDNIQKHISLKSQGLKIKDNEHFSCTVYQQTINYPKIY